MTFKLNPPIECLHIISTLRSHGYQAYLVGGCVRDAIIGRVPNDWDITTSAHPDQVKAIFPRTFDTGLQHGTVSVKDIVGNIYEVTTFRSDGQYEDGRHPTSVKFISSIEDDLARRDFTINAIAWNETSGFIDPFGGIQNIEKKIIRTVGDPTQRFTEDGLRILRALRFSAELTFEIEQETFSAIFNLPHLLDYISIERKRDELCKILLSAHPEYTALLNKTNALEHLSPEIAIGFSNHLQKANFGDIGFEHEYNSAEHILLLQLSALLHGSNIDEVSANSVLRKLRFSNKTISNVKIILQFVNCYLPSSEKEMRILCNKVQPRLLPYIFALRFVSADDSQAKLLSVVDLFRQVMSKQPCLTISELAINGNDLLSLGFIGKDIATVQQHLLDLVLDQPARNKKAILMKEAKKIAEKNAKKNAKKCKKIISKNR